LKTLIVVLRALSKQHNAFAANVVCMLNICAERAKWSLSRFFSNAFIARADSIKVLICHWPNKTQQRFLHTYAYYVRERNSLFSIEHFIDSLAEIKESWAAAIREEKRTYRQ